LNFIIMKTSLCITLLLTAALKGQVIEVVPATPGVVVVEETYVEPTPPIPIPVVPGGLVDSLDALNLPPREVVEIERTVEVSPLPGVVAPDVQALHDAHHRAALDQDLVRRQFAIDPRVVDFPFPAPGGVVQTETIIEEIRPRRVYYPERNVVVVIEEEQARELPYVTVPVLFVKGTAELLDAESRVALEQMAALILETREREPEAVFDIEGHTSTDGPDDFNMRLSAERAKRVYDELTLRYNVPPSMLTAHGFGENYPMHPDGTEEQMMLDRRVLIVRVR